MEVEDDGSQSHSHFSRFQGGDRLPLQTPISHGSGPEVSLGWGYEILGIEMDPLWVGVVECWMAERVWESP